MRENLAALLLVLVLLTASSAIAFTPVSAAYPGSWTSKAPMRVARGYLGVAAVNGKIYAIGGNTQSGPWTNMVGGPVGTNEEYDPETDTWVFKKPMPTSRYYFATALYQNKIYCIGGYLTNGTATGINEAYDPATDTWETRAPMKTIRISLEANAANGMIYLIGGYVPASYTTQNFTATPINEAYDPATDSWSTKTPMPVAVNGYASAVVDNRIYIIGGVSYPEYNFNQIYDPKTDTWSQGAPMPSNTAYGAAGATTGANALKRIYVLSRDFSYSEPPYVNGVYDPEKDRWTFGESIPTERQGFGVAVLNDMLYAIGGQTETYTEPLNWYSSLLTVYATNEQYTPFGYGAPDPSYDGTAPEIAVLSPENKTYTAGNVSLTFTVNELASEMAYSLDGAENVTVAGNVTLAGLPSGAHNVMVYARDQAGNAGGSEIVGFAVAVPEPESFPLLPAALTVALIAVAVGVGLLLYRRKRQGEAGQP